MPAQSAVSAASGGAAAPAVEPVAGLSVLAGRYKALLLDQFGVLHDGRRPYPGAVAAVSAAAAAGLRLLIISNSSRRSSGTLDKLAGMGFDPGCFAGVVTSGELTHRYLTTRPDGWWAGLGRRCLHLNWSKRGPASLEDFALEVVTDPAAADFILAHGTEGLSLPGGGVREVPLEELRGMLTAAAEAGRGGRLPPMVVANPDVVTVDGGALVAMPGSLAASYAAAGGLVRLMGKPSPLIYAACEQVLRLEARELLAVGDSLEHDVAGAAAAGIDSFFIAGGIHEAELVGEQQQQQQQPDAAGSGAAAGGVCAAVVDQQALQRLCGHHLPPGVAPTYVAHRFVW